MSRAKLLIILLICIGDKLNAIRPHWAKITDVTICGKEYYVRSGKGVDKESALNQSVLSFLCSYAEQHGIKIKSEMISTLQESLQVWTKKFRYNEEYIKSKLNQMFKKMVIAETPIFTMPNYNLKKVYYSYEKEGIRAYAMFEVSYREPGLFEPLYARIKTLMYYLVPGMGQIREGNATKGILIPLSITGLISGGAYLRFVTYEKYISERENYLKLYENAPDYETAQYYYKLAQRSQEKADLTYKLSMGLIISAGVVYALNILDGFLCPPYLQLVRYDKNEKIKVSMNYDFIQNSMVLNFNIRGEQ